MNKTLIILDASALKDSSCLLRLFNTVVLGYKTKIDNNDIHFGTAFHKFRSIWRTNNDDYMLALLTARNHYANTPMFVKSNKKYLTESFLTDTISAYAVKYKQDIFQPLTTPCEISLFDGATIPAGTKLIEPLTRFAFPYYVDDEVEVLVAGTIDELGQYRDGKICICDAKTTSVWNQEEYFRSYKLSPQLITYRWALRKYAREFPGSYLAELDASEICAMIDGIFYAGADKPVVFRRSETYNFSENDIDEFDRLVKYTVNLLVEAVRHWRKTNQEPLRYGLLNGSCQTPYGPCKYFGPCSAPDEESRTTMLEDHFKKAAYNPLTHGE